MRALVILCVFTCVKLIDGKVQHYSDPDPSAVGENSTPIVGVLTQEVSSLILRRYPGRDFKSYIAASYVKFIEGAGGRVVPIWINRPRAYYEDIMTKINGVLLPGGATYFNQSQGYADAGRYIFEIASEINDRGLYMPLWGTCLGFELMLYLTANDTEPRTYCSSSSQALPLEFKDGFEKSRLFRNASNELINIWRTHPVTANFHMYCVTEETFAKTGLDKIWTTLTVNHDWDGIEFISIIEHKKYPFYGVQFHPEKNLYEFVPHRNISHSAYAVRSSQYFADFLVNEARKNPNHFLNKTEESGALIYNYKPEYTGLVGSVFVQQYLFGEDDDKDKSGGRNGGSSCTEQVRRGSLFIFSLGLIYLRVFFEAK